MKLFKKQAAVALGINPRTLADYWDRGLLTFRQGNRYRYIDDLELAKLELAEIKEYAARRGLWFLQTLRQSRQSSPAQAETAKTGI